VIGSLRGTLLDVDVGRAEALVEVGGIGYRVAVTPATLASLGDPGEAAFLHTSQQVREDSVTLYGFPTRDERACFEALLGAHGVGPAMAMAILAVHDPAGLRRILVEGDADALTLVPGVGKKTAARLLLELRSRLSVPEADGTTAVAGTPRAEAREALAALGYGPDEIRDALADADAGEGRVEALVRDALRRLAAARLPAATAP
jgi:Holliday junction DNA helicase RuvA